MLNLRGCCGIRSTSDGGKIVQLPVFIQQRQQVTSAQYKCVRGKGSDVSKDIVKQGFDFATKYAHI